MPPSSRAKMAADTPKPSTNTSTSSPPSRIPPPKLRLKDRAAKPSLASLVYNLLFPDHSAFVFSEEDEAEFRWYSQHNRDLQERRDREREVIEDRSVLATSSQFAQMGAQLAEVVQDTYNPPVRRTLREFALAFFCSGVR